MMAMRKPGVYVALSAHYADDEKIMAAGEDAELLYVRMLAYCARTPMTEGWISDAVVMSRLGILPRPDEAGTDAGSRAGKLVDVGLIRREGRGYRIISWLRWNRSIEEMGRERTRDRNRKTSGNDGKDAGNATGNDAGTDQGIPHDFRMADQIRSDTDHAGSDEPRADVRDLCDALSEALTHNGVKHTIGKRWHTAARLILDSDGRPFDEVIEVIDYATTDDFWRPNILSMTKLREKYDTLRLQMQRKPAMSRQDEVLRREWARINAEECGDVLPMRQIGGAW